MSDRDDIESGRLIYACNCGWIDLNHMNDPSTRKFFGSKNLWKQIREGDSTPEAQATKLCPSLGFRVLPPRPAVRLRNVYGIAHFPDGKQGFKVTYKQDMGNQYIKQGVNRSYLVRYGLSWEEKRRVALVIFMEVSVLFEGLQDSFPWNVVTDSGFSQEDLVSNLLGFYIAIGDYTQNKC